jgi:hypothetical protein
VAHWSAGLHCTGKLGVSLGVAGTRSRATYRVTDQAQEKLHVALGVSCCYTLRWGQSIGPAQAAGLSRVGDGGSRVSLA